VTRAEYNKCGLYREMLTYKPLTNSAVQEEENMNQVGKNKKVIIKSNNKNNKNEAI
jgi:hypothetical protein